MPLTIYKSSAGSGKTYTLAKEYLRLSLRSADYYKQILAVTFTNRAAEEMKERVLEFLVAIANGKHELIEDFAEELDKSPEEITTRAKQTLTHLLHNYGYFNITTIDTFFHRVIRSFSREIGLQGNFSIELDDKKVSDYIAADLFDGVEENTQLKQWLIDFSMNRLGDGRGYEFKNEIRELAGQLFSEDFKKLPHDQFLEESTKEKLKELQQELFKTRYAFERNLKRIANEFFDAFESSGLPDGCLIRGKVIPGFFNRLIIKEFKDLIGSTIQNAYDDTSAWVAKSSPVRDQVLVHAEAKFQPLLREAIDYYYAKETEYFTSRAVLKHLYTLGLLNDLTQRLQTYKQDQEIIMISDLPDFLTQIIRDAEAPFIYEKVGSRYSHFLIDEFQDTSVFQWNNFKPLLQESLAGGHENIIVGDAKQSIYGFRGGDPSLLMTGISADIPDAKSEKKTTNFRSAPEIVKFNNDLFAALPDLLATEAAEEISEEGAKMIRLAYEGVEQEVFEKKAEVPGKVRVEFFERDKELGNQWNEQAIARTINLIESLQKDGHSLNDMAMLVRTNWEAAQIVQAILDYKRDHQTTIEVISADGMLIANSRVVQLLLTGFDYLLNPHNAVLERDLVFQYQQVVLGRRINDHEGLSGLNVGQLPEQFRKHQEHLLHLPIYELTEVLIRLFKLDQVEDEFAYLQAFQDAILEFTKKNRSDVRVFMEWWQDEAEKRSVQLTGALDAIEVITLHKSKGLQYPIVIVPLCKFDLDSRKHTSWYKAPQDQPYDVLDSVPIDYSSSLTKTKFSGNYKDEMAKWFLESLNMLYVAFTRAERGLYAFCEPPSKSTKVYSHTSSLLHHYFSTCAPEGWNPHTSVYESGELSVELFLGESGHIQLSGYPTFKWSNRLTIRKTGQAYFDEEAEQKRSEGILLHQILAEIITHDQSEGVLDRFEKQMLIDHDDRERFGKLISGLWENEQVKLWFDASGDVKTEVVVLPDQGETKRIDRVILKGDRATVIDFKSGAKRPNDEAQVKEYSQLLERMGYKAEGWLLYLKTGEVVSI